MNAEQKAQAAGWATMLSEWALSRYARTLTNDDCRAISNSLLDGIAASERLEDFESDFRATVGGDCAPDEKHCSCVPHLRKAVKAASEECERLRAHVHTDNRETLKNALAEIERLGEELRCSEAEAATWEAWHAEEQLESQQAWLAAWDAEWHRQFETADAASLANDYVDACVANAKLRAMLERAAGVVKRRVDGCDSYCQCFDGGDERDCNACRWATDQRDEEKDLLTEIEEVGK